LKALNHSHGNKRREKIEEAFPLTMLRGDGQLLWLKRENELAGEIFGSK